MYDIELDVIVAQGVSIPRQSISVKGLESSQSHEDPEALLWALDSVVLEYQGVEYDLGHWSDIDSDTSEVLLEWLSPS